MQTTAIRTVANSLPEKGVILLTLLISDRYILLQNYKINVEYQKVASEMILPIFYTKTSASVFSEEEWIPLENLC